MEARTALNKFFLKLIQHVKMAEKNIYTYSNVFKQVVSLWIMNRIQFT